MNEQPRGPAQEVKRSNFDLKTHPRHPKSGHVMHKNLYRLFARQVNNGTGVEWVFERPVGSGIYYYANNELVAGASEEGLRKQELAEKERTKSVLEKAKSNFENAKKEVERAEVEHKIEQETQRKLEAQKKGN